MRVNRSLILAPVSFFCMAAAIAMMLTMSAIPISAKVISETPSITAGGVSIEGELFRPEITDRLPTVILIHGFGEDYLATPYAYARSFAEAGFAAYTFTIPDQDRDSVLHEAARIHQIIDEVKKLPFVDTSRLFLFGDSQGGFDAANVASQRQDIRSLILLFPAFVLQDDALNRHSENGPYKPILKASDFPFSSADLAKMDFPNIENMGFADVPDPFTRDALSFDIYERIRTYPNDVLIIHGDQDDLVPLSYSQKAIQTFPKAELKIITGAGHGFDSDTSLALSKEWCLDFLIRHAASTPGGSDGIDDSGGADGTNTSGASNLLTEAQKDHQLRTYKSNKDLPDSTYGILQAKLKTAKKHSITITWNPAEGATAYAVYGSRCTKNGKGKPYKKLATVRKTKYTQKKLKPGTCYRYVVVALGGGYALATSKTIYIATAGGAFGNDKSVNVSRSKITLKPKKSITITAHTVPQKAFQKTGKYRSISFETSDPTVATVTRKGKKVIIKGVSKGKCIIYAYAQDGVCKPIHITIKNQRTFP